MKKIVLNILIALLIGGIGFFTVDLYKEYQIRTERWDKISVLKSMDLEDVNGRPINFDSLSSQNR